MNAGEALARPRHQFIIEGWDETDALPRVLGLIAVQQPRLLTAHFEAADGRILARLEVEGLGHDRAVHLCHRLGQLPLVTCVSFGWRM